MLIQWYPGHMAKARRMLVENLKLIDAIVEIVDARAPIATRNPDFDDLFAQKKRVLLLVKGDLADPAHTREWLDFYAQSGVSALALSASKGTYKRAAAVELIEKAAAEKVEAYRRRGVVKTVRAMVVGIPNVGKSTFINRMAGASRAQTGDRPGVTKAKQWIKISQYLELMDTPGLLWPKLENEKLARDLAYIGSIKDDIMDVEQLAGHLLVDLMRVSAGAVTARYTKAQPDMDGQALLESVCQSRGMVLSGGRYDTERAARIVLDEFRAGRIAKITLNTVREAAQADEGA